SPRPPFFALLIGINTYKNSQIPDLSGCVDDVEDMFRFLTKTVGVDPGNIVVLRDQQATRQAIMRSLRSFGDDERIQIGDPILVFFAGHGAQTKPPPSWEAGGPNALIQMLVPYGFDPDTNEDEDSQGVLDITLSVILSDIAGFKGTNITVIFDSCHSGSGSRVDQGGISALITRGIALKDDYQILASVDEDVFKDNRREPLAAKGEPRTSMFSHVLLAACSSDGEAHESNGRGLFTHALLDHLRNPTIPFNMLTYIDVIKGLPDLPKQSPQCEGYYAKSILFDKRALNRHSVLYHRVQRLTDGGDITLMAGEAHGVSEGATFDLYDMLDGGAEPFAKGLVANRPRMRTTKLRLAGDTGHISLGPQAWAWQTSLGKRDPLEEVCIAVPDNEDMLKELTAKMDEERTDARSIWLVSKDKPHELAISESEDGKVAKFSITDKISNDNGLIALPLPVEISFEADKLRHVMEAARYFFYHLRRSNKRMPRVTHLKLEAWELAESKTLKGTFEPTGPDLNAGGLMSVLVDETPKKKYGFKLVNLLNMPWYVWIFAFNMSDLSIGNGKKPGQEADVSLPAGGSLTIGYGAGGADPQEFYFEDNINLEVTYLKIFVTSHNVDLENIVQESPFTDERGVFPKPVPLGELWDTVLLAIVQKS
ncbi:caspase domain-containing protein, partial [Vararia minispora EC-137]